MRRIASCFAVVIALAGVVGGRARADVTAPKPPPLVGVTQAVRLAPDKGFIDDPIGFDGARLAYVNTDAATFTVLVVYDVATKAEKLRTALPADLGIPASIDFVGAGDAARVLVVGRDDAGAARAALIALDGKVVRRFGPATDVTLIVRAGAPRIVLHRARVKPAGKGGTTHEVELVDLDKGKRVGKLRTLDLDGGGTAAKLELRVNHWSDGYTHAVGVKGGHWDPKENQRTPDTIADYDLVDGTFKSAPIDDPAGTAKRLQVLAARPVTARPVFARMSDDLATIELWRSGAPAALELDQPVAQYDPASLASAVDDQGAVWLMLEVDPVNAAAVKRQKADPQYLDLFAVDAGGGKATRRARVLATPKKKYATGVAGGRWWLLERSVGFDRGGTSLTVFAPAP